MEMYKSLIHYLILHQFLHLWHRHNLQLLNFNISIFIISILWNSANENCFTTLCLHPIWLHHHQHKTCIKDLIVRHDPKNIVVYFNCIFRNYSWLCCFHRRIFWISMWNMFSQTCFLWAYYFDLRQQQQKENYKLEIKNLHSAANKS